MDLKGVNFHFGRKIRIVRSPAFLVRFHYHDQQCHTRN
jgi:hypothetical protein